MSSSIIDTDPWLEPYRQKIEARQSYVARYRARLLAATPLDTFALGHLHFGLHSTSDGWTLREWAPNATAVYLLCDANQWKKDARFTFQSINQGEWEINLSRDALHHLDKYRLLVEWAEGSGERIPSYATYVTQDLHSKSFNATVWQPSESYIWQHEAPAPASPELIYEAHVGMSSEKEEVASYVYFTKNILPKIKDLGYTTIQLMAIQEHPYYGSFGYHVSNFFAASSRFGTPNELKALIDTAHGMGLRVIMDIVHSHAVKNEIEGLSRFDGTRTQYFHEGERGNHPAWDSRTFDYEKPEVAHFLLSNLRFWLDEYRFDGFRFDGITSILYHDHGLGKAFSSYDNYFSDNVDQGAIAYLHLANELTHTIAPNAITIAEDMSALPGLAASTEEGGVGFDYRLSMGVPDLWIKTIKEQKDEDWNLGHLFHELTSHRPEEKTISYVESHDQALVGDKTIIFRLIDKAMYEHMRINDQDSAVERGIALHKLIRLLTASTNHGGYLTFMGNEFGHPEWIDFPREGNDWSYHYARRQWSLAQHPELKYQWLLAFEQTMTPIVRTLNDTLFHYVTIDEERKLISFIRDNHLFVFNFSPTQSYADCKIPTFNGDYSVVLSSDSPDFGGYNRIDTVMQYTARDETLALYIPSRTALVLALQSQ
jgi:1,4-alpha-glucan branching enzyme